MSRTRWGIVLLSFGAAIGVSVWIVVRGVGSAGALPVLPWWAHAGALGVVLFEIASRAVKIHWSAAALRIPLTFGASLRTCLAGDFAANITPGRSGAEPARFFVLAEAGIKPAHTMLILFTEIFLEMISLAVVSLALAVIFQGSGTVVGAMVGVVSGYAVFVLGVGAAGYFLARRSASGPPPRMVTAIGFNAGHWRAVQRMLRHLRGSISAVREAKIGAMLASLLASIVHVIGKLAVLPVLVWAVAPGVAFAPLILWGLVFLYGSALAPAPAGGGAIEYGFTLAFKGVLTPSVLAGSLIWWRVYTLYLYILLGALAAGRTVMRALKDDA